MTVQVRYMYDSVNLAGIPKITPPGTIIAPYLDGTYAVKSVLEVQTLWPNRPINWIDVIGNRADYARTLDVEKGLVKPGACEDWITQWNATNPAYKDGGRPEIYCNRSTIPSVRVGTGKYRLAHDYFLWVATGDGTEATDETEGLPTGSINACQTRWYVEYDLSVVYNPHFLP